jgi:flagellar motor protein MotB
MSRRQRHPETPWASFADAMSGMLFVFIITTFWFAWKLATEQEKAKAAQEVAEQETKKIQNAQEVAQNLTKKGEPDSLLDCLRATGAGELDAIPQSAEARVLLYLRGGELWFATGERTLTARHHEPLARVRTCIDKLIALQEPGKRLDPYRLRVYLEGHTDAVPIDNPDITNWELSAMRATSVLRTVVEGSTVIREAQSIGSVELLAVGMADRQPAWRRICDDAKEKQEFTDRADRSVCDHADEGFNKAAIKELQTQPAMFAFDEQCRPTQRDLGAAPADLIRWWANRCVDPSNGQKNPRLELLRRVDIRLELTPLQTEKP